MRSDSIFRTATAVFLIGFLVYQNLDNELGRYGPSHSVAPGPVVLQVFNQIVVNNTTQVATTIIAVEGGASATIHTSTTNSTANNKTLPQQNGNDDNNNNNNHSYSVGSNTNSSDSLHNRTLALENALQETVRLLYANSPHLEFWLDQPLPRIYIYESIAQDWSNATLISDCIDRVFLGDKLGGWRNCKWYPNICTDVHPPSNSQEAKYMAYRYNHVVDIGQLEWFRSYPQKTLHLEEADLLLVPYPYWSRCVCQRGETFHKTICPDKFSHIKMHVLKHLPVQNRTTSNRHLWLFGTDTEHIGARVRSRSQVSLSLGTTTVCQYNTTPCGHLAHPYMNTNDCYQPNKLSQQPWWDNSTKRPFAMGCIMGTPHNLEMRLDFQSNHQKHIGDRVGGKPIRFVDLGKRRAPMTEEDMAKVYRQSIFCPIFPGDTAQQKRFFDAMLNGCIPLVPAWESMDSTEFPSNFRYQFLSTQKTYPFHAGTFFGDKHAGIDYVRDLLVTFDGACGVPCMKDAMETVLANGTELERLQSNVRKHAPLFSYGLEDNSYRYVDAFAALLVSLRHYLYGISDKLP